MPRSANLFFNDPLSYQGALRAAEVDLLVTARGTFCVDLHQIDFDELCMQHGRETLARTSHAVFSRKRASVIFPSDGNQAAMRLNGTDVPPGTLIFAGVGATHHLRTLGPCNWTGISLPPDVFRAASRSILGHELTVPAVSRVMRPNPANIARLVTLGREARQLAGASPDIFTYPEVGRALEQAFVHALVLCLVDASSEKVGSRIRHHSAVIARLEETLAENYTRPMYLGEICAAIGTSERTLRVCCEEHFGVGPIKYLWLRRMHLARRALIEADPGHATVTRVATDHGFWELGRFSVAYRALFGESPSASLHRPATASCRIEDRLSSLSSGSLQH